MRGRRALAAAFAQAKLVATRADLKALGIEWDRCYKNTPTRVKLYMVSRNVQGRNIKPLIAKVARKHGVTITIRRCEWRFNRHVYIAVN